jgi:O-antigen/teichoic acid export membrane protein
MISLLFISLGYLFNVLALCLNLEKWLALKAILAITIYLISAVVLIPIYGIMGSVIATIVANLSFVILINLVVPSQRKILNLYIKR